MLNSRDQNIEYVSIYEGLYVLSCEGELISFHKRNYGKTITMRIDRAGYYTVRLSQYGKTKTFFLHRLLAEAFVPNPENKSYVNHINGDKLDYALSNLEWTTGSENAHHAFQTGLCLAGEKNSKCVVNTDTGEYYRSMKEAARLFQIPYSTFKNYMSGRRKNKTRLKRK